MIPWRTWTHTILLGTLLHSLVLFLVGTGFASCLESRLRISLYTNIKLEIVGKESAYSLPWMH